jgi:hypothetical protein
MRMTLDEIDIKVGHGTAQVLSILGMLGGWGGTIATGIASISGALPKNAFTTALIGAGVLIGGVSNWMLTQARTKTLAAKADVYVAHLYHAAQEVEKQTGLDVPVVEQDVPPTLPRI